MFSDKINHAYRQLNETDLAIIAVIMEHFLEMPFLGIEQLSKKCNYSRSSILRTAKKLGFSGYAEMRNYIGWEIERTEENKETILPQLQHEAEETLQGIENSKSFDKVVDLMIRKKRIFIYGTGEGQKNCANEIQRLFMQIGVYVFVIKASSEFQIITKELTKDDIVLVISLSGEVTRYQEAIQMLKAKQIHLVSLTALSNNPLASLANDRLYAISSPVLLANHETHNSFVSFYLVGECLFRKYAEKTKMIETSH